MAKEVTIIAGPHGLDFAKTLAEKLQAPLIRAESKVFPDGETYVRLPSRVETAVAVVVATMYPGQNDAIVEAMLLAEASRGAGAKAVILVAPYMAYTRQDRRFLDGEPISIRAVLKALHAAGVDGFITVDIHKEASLADFPGPSLNVDPSPAIAEYLKSIGYTGDDVVIIGPDKGALGRAERVASKLGTSHDYLEKFRDRVTGEVTYRPKTVEVKGKRVVLVDDIISTGGTIAKAARMLYEQGAKEVVAVCTHGLFVSNALEKLSSAKVKRVAASDTIPRLPEGVDKYSVVGLVADSIDYMVKRVL